MEQQLKFTASIEGFEKVQKGFAAIGQSAEEISADIQKSTNNLRAFQAALKQSTNTGEINFLQKSIAGLTDRLKSLKEAQNKVAQSSGGVVMGSNQAAQALSNLGRIAQDAPFGFLGISNNINPLLESFQRLKAETGSTGIALKSLASSLTGAGGIGLAVSVVTSLLVVFGDSIFGGSKAMDSLNPKLLTFSETINDAKESLKEFNKQSEFLSKLNDINIKINLGDGKGGKSDFIATLTTAQAKVLDIAAAIENSEKLTAKLAENRSAAFDELQRQVNKVTGVFGDGNKEFKRFIDSFNSIADIPDDALSKLPESQQAYVKAVKESTSALSDQQNKTGDLNKDLQIQAATIRLIREEEKRRQEKTKETGETVADVLQKLRQQQALLKTEQSFFGINSQDAEKQINGILQTAVRLVSSFKIDPNGTIIKKLLVGDSDSSIDGITSVATTKVKEVVRRIQIAAQNEFIKSPVEIPIDPVIKFDSSALPKADLGPILNDLPNQQDLDTANKVGFLLSVGVATGLQDGLNVNLTGLRFPNLDALYNDVKSKLTKLKDDINQIIASTIGSALSSVAEVIGTALASGDISAGLDKFVSVLSQGLKEIGQALVQYGIAKTIVSKLKISGPAAIAAGFAIQVAAAALEASVNKRRFATGGVFLGGNSFIAGERGPEIITAPSGTRITPSSQTNSILGSGNRTEVFGEFRISNKDLVIAFKNGQKSLNNQN